MVMLSSYEKFVGRFGDEALDDSPEWLRRLDPDGGVTFGLAQANAPIVLVAPTSAGQLMAVAALGQIYKGDLNTLNPTNLAPVFVPADVCPGRLAVARKILYDHGDHAV